MANEISLSGSLQIVKSGVTISGSVSKTITQAGDQSLGNIQIIGMSSEAVMVGDVTTIGYLYLKNLDATNFVSFDIATPCVAANAPVTLLAGECAVIPTRKAAWYAIADTGNVNVHVIAIEL